MKNTVESVGVLKAVKNVEYKTVLSEYILQRNGFVEGRGERSLSRRLQSFRKNK